MQSVVAFFSDAVNLKTLLVLGLIAVIVALPTWILVKWSRNFPPAFRHPKLASGFGGWLIIFLAGQVAWFLRGVWETCYLSGELLYVYQKSPGTLLSILVAVLPTFLALILGAVVIYEILTKRRPSAIAVVIVSVWIMGPAVAGLQSWYFDSALTELSIFELFGWALIWTLYFAVSRRVALTYGTPRGKHLAETGNLN